MLDVEDEEDEEGEVDAELDADAGALNLFEYLILSAKSALQKQVIMRTRKQMKMKIACLLHSRGVNAIHSSQLDTKAIGLTSFEATISEFLTMIRTIRSNTTLPSARYLRRKGRSSGQKR